MTVAPQLNRAWIITPNNNFYTVVVNQDRKSIKREVIFEKRAMVRFLQKDNFVTMASK